MTDQPIEEPQEPPEAPQRPRDEFDEMSPEELEEAMRQAQERTRRTHVEEAARAEEELHTVRRSLRKVFPTAEEILARTDAAEREERERARRRAEREPELKRVKMELWVSRTQTHHARFAEATLDALQPSSRSTVDAWIDDDNPGTLMIVGGVGTGKTYAAFAVMREMFLRGQTVKFWPVPKLLDALRPSTTSSTETIFEEASTIDLLVLDDIGSEKPTDWTMERLYILVNDRWMAKRRMIITSNLNMDTLLTSIGERMFSRFIDNGYMLDVGMKDRRETR